MPLRSCKLSAAIRVLIGPCFSTTVRNLSNASVHTTKPSGTVIPAPVSSPNEPPFPPTAARSSRVISANQRMFEDARIQDGSQVQLTVDRYSVLAAITLEMVDEQEDIGRFHEVAVFVIEFDRSLEPGEQFDAIRVIAHQCVYQSRRFVDEVPRARNPIVFEIAGVAFQAHHHNGPAMFVGADHPGGLEPENVAEDIVSRIKQEMSDCGIRTERHPWAFFLR